MAKSIPAYERFEAAKKQLEKLGHDYKIPDILNAKNSVINEILDNVAIASWDHYGPKRVETARKRIFAFRAKLKELGVEVRQERLDSVTPQGPNMADYLGPNRSNATYLHDVLTSISNGQQPTFSEEFHQLHIGGVLNHLSDRFSDRYVKIFKDRVEDGKSFTELGEEQDVTGVRIRTIFEKVNWFINVRSHAAEELWHQTVFTTPDSKE